MSGHSHIDHLFRHSYGQLIAILIRRFGAERLEDIEDAVQEAMLRAMKVWPYQEIPENPLAWLVKVAHNQLIDSFRKTQRFLLSGNQPDDPTPVELDEPLLDHQIRDDQLKLIFICCHPYLSEEAQVILTLKLVLGFGNREVANALLKNEEAVAKAYTRAKKKLKSTEIRFDHSLEVGLRSRLFVVLKIIYLIFTEGYKPFQGNEIIRRDLCYEAIRLTILLDENPFCEGPSTKALIALMCFHTSRFDARQDASGTLVDLEHQDRTLWDRDLIEIGIKYLDQATGQTDDPLDYILQAFLSYYHCIAPSFEKTDWKSILRIYDIHLSKQYSPILALNRLIPFSMVHGPNQAYAELLNYEHNPSSIRDILFYAVKGELAAKSGKIDLARQSYQQAINLGENKMEIRHLQKKMQNL